MTTDRFASWVQIIGNFGLLAGLILVGVQIQQNTTAVQAQMLSDQMAASIALRLTIAGENPAAAMSKAIAQLKQIEAYDQRKLERTRESLKTDRDAG